MRRGIGRLVVVVVLTASAVTAAPARPPNLARIPGTPAPSHGRIYADCLAQAASAGNFDRTSDKDTHLLRFRCSGPPAQAFYDALASWSAARQSEWMADGRTWRATEKIQRDLFGTDYCFTGDGGDYACEVTVNVGAFLDGG